MSKSSELGSKLILTAIKVLKEKDGELPFSELLELIPSKIALDEWATETYSKTGYIRWHSILQFYSIGLVKAKSLIKKKGIWYLTPEGENLVNLSEADILAYIKKKYQEWKYDNLSGSDTEIRFEDVKEEVIEQENDKNSVILEDALSKGNKSFTHFIERNFDAYTFQDLCGALFRGMGYYTPFIAPKGKDGGVDIIAYKDPIGSSYPHIKIQVKYRKEAKATSQELRQLKGILTQNDIGVFISISGFASDAIKEFKHTSPHIELIDLPRFIELWQEFYDKMKEEDKALMPIRPVYFVDDRD